MYVDADAMARTTGRVCVRVEHATFASVQGKPLHCRVCGVSDPLRAARVTSFMGCMWRVGV